MEKNDARKSLERQTASEKDDREDSASLGDSSKRDRHKKSRRSKHHTSSEEDDSSSCVSGDERRRHKSSKRRRSRSSHRRSRRSSTESESEESSLSDSESESDSDSEERRRERRRRREKEERRRKEKDRERGKRKKEKEEKRKKEKRRKEKEKKKEKEMGNTGAVTNKWGQYGIIREVDMWNKRPEFTAWLAEVRQINLESLSRMEEKQMFKEFMEDHNTATFPSKKYYDLEAFHRRQLEKEMKKGLKNVPQERTIFDDEEQRRIEMLKERERQKEAEVEALKRSMQSGLAQAMKEQARLREEMMFLYRVGNKEAAAAIQKRLDPDAPP